MHILDWSEHEPPQRRLFHEDHFVGGPLKLRLTLPVCLAEEKRVASPEAADADEAPAA
jgi:hypothetical protein